MNKAYICIWPVCLLTRSKISAASQEASACSFSQHPHQRSLLLWCLSPFTSFTCSWTSSKLNYEICTLSCLASSTQHVLFYIKKRLNHLSMTPYSYCIVVETEAQWTLYIICEKQSQAQLSLFFFFFLTMTMFSSEKEPENLAFNVST